MEEGFIMRENFESIGRGVHQTRLPSTSERLAYNAYTRTIQGRKCNTEDSNDRKQTNESEVEQGNTVGTQEKRGVIVERKRCLTLSH